ncbi:ferric reductase-like transmembrane domain-containing protein [Candidatus Pacearchaeota archaeon]|nr:ferric reductase-like transmembrane domain-containing protein [Candidatus Pacearchaeota archaeon]
MDRKIPPFLFFIFLSLFSIVLTFVVFKPFIFEDISINLGLYSIGKLAGLLSFLFLSILIISGDTARFFDKFFGMDKIIKFQRKFSLITAVFVIAHPLFFMLSSGNYLNYLIPNFVVFPLALGTISLYIFVIVMICSSLYKRISHQIWQYIHILTYLLFFFSLYHAIKIGSDTKNIFIKSILSILLIGIIIGGTYRAYYKIKHKKFKCYVKEIKWETKDTFTLILKPNKKLNFKAGQFCFLRLNKNKLYARHPFTISNSPKGEDLHFTIKLTGKFTKAASELKKGEEVIVDGPFGIFTLQENNKDLIFLAGGVGITPFMSMIRNQLKNRCRNNIFLFYCSKKEGETIFKSELSKIKEKWLKIVYIFSQEDSCSEICEKGYINKEIIKRYIPCINSSIFYICGPEPMKILCKKELKSLGVNNKNIITESFFW